MRKVSAVMGRSFRKPEHMVIAGRRFHRPPSTTTRSPGDSGEGRCRAAHLDATGSSRRKAGTPEGLAAKNAGRRRPAFVADGTGVPQRAVVSAPAPARLIVKRPKPTPMSQPLPVPDNAIVTLPFDITAVRALFTAPAWADAMA